MIEQFLLVLAILGFSGITDVECEKSQEEQGKQLKFAFVIFLHGERTPSYSELSYLTDKDRRHLKSNDFYPDGLEALTKKGKERSYRVGQYLRSRYKCILSSTYLPDEILIRSTDYARTKMSALLALASLYVPVEEQNWNEQLKWQPIPYEYLPYEMDDLLYYRNCPRYINMRSAAYQDPEIEQQLREYKSTFESMSKYTYKKISTPEDVFNLEKCMRGLRNYDLRVPTWYTEYEKDVRPIIKIDFDAQFRTTDMIRLAAGPMMTEMFDTLDLIQANDSSLTMKMYLVSAHENIIIAWLAASKANRTRCHPFYGATYSIEVYYLPRRDDYEVEAFYLPSSSSTSPERVEIKHCVDHSKGNYCSIQGFKTVTAKYKMTYSEFQKECRKP